MNYAVNDKQVLLLGLGLRNNPKNYATVKLYKSSKKPVITIQHQHLAFGVQFKDIQFLNNGKVRPLLIPSLYSRFVAQPPSVTTSRCFARISF